MYKKLICFIMSMMLIFMTVGCNNNEVEEENNAVTTYALNEQAEAVPAFISALRKTQNDRKN